MTAPAPRKATILAAQIDIPADMASAADRDRHVERIAGLIDAALARRPADVVMLPELSNIAYSRHCFARPEVFAETETGPGFQALSPIARARDAAILYGAPAATGDGRLAITQFLIDRHGQPAGRYAKLHLAQFGASMEKDYFTTGSGLLVFEVGGMRLAPVICYDMRFAGLADELARQRRVDAILHAVAFYRDESFYSWRAFVVARALENQVYWLSLNRAGSDFGGSILCPPWVDDTAREHVMGTAEELCWFDITADAIARARTDYTFLADRLADYSAL